MFLEALLRAGGRGAQIEEGDFNASNGSQDTQIPVEVADYDMLYAYRKDGVTGQTANRCCLHVEASDGVKIVAVDVGYYSSGIPSNCGIGAVKVIGGGLSAGAYGGTWHYIAIKWS